MKSIAVLIIIVAGFFLIKSQLPTEVTLSKGEVISYATPASNCDEKGQATEKLNCTIEHSCCKKAKSTELEFCSEQGQTIYSGSYLDFLGLHIESSTTESFAQLENQ